MELLTETEIRPCKFCKCNVEANNVPPKFWQTVCYMPQLGTLNYLPNVDNLFIDYSTLIKARCIFTSAIKAT